MNAIIMRDVMMNKHRRKLAVLVFMLGSQMLHAQAPSPTALADVKRLKCTFTLQVTGTWTNGVPSAEQTPATLSMQFDAIDTQEGTASVGDVSTLSAGTPHLTVRLLADSLHFIAMNDSGSVYLTTVFADRDSRAGAKFKAVHTRHEFTQMQLTGWTSRPELRPSAQPHCHRPHSS
jgi:hypothetical protein